MKLRRLTDAGVAAFAAYLTQVKDEPTLTPPRHLLEDADLSEPVADVEVEDCAFNTRLDVARYLDDTFRRAGLNTPQRDVGLWSWLTLLFFDQLSPPKKDGTRTVGERARYVPQVEVVRRFYRHMLLGPFTVFRAHTDRPERLFAILSDPLHVATSETYRLFIENPALITCKAVVEVATWLYYDPERGKVKRGSGTKVAGGCRRLVSFLQQIDLTYDLPAITKQNLSTMLPKEFHRFVPQQLTLAEAP